MLKHAGDCGKRGGGFFLTGVEWHVYKLHETHYTAELQRCYPRAILCQALQHYAQVCSAFF